MNPLTHSKRPTILPVLLALTLACFGLSPRARAVCNNGCTAYGHNTLLGEDAFFNDYNSEDSTAIGYRALRNNWSGDNNTANGAYALFSNVYGDSNTANGTRALYNTTGDSNTASGAYALSANTTASYNTATGFEALYNNTTGSPNTASGSKALYSNTLGMSNTAVGASALYLNVSGNNNTAVGSSALLSSTASNNVAMGQATLFYNVSGGNNTAVGTGAMVVNTTGSNNIALGYHAGFNLTTGGNNIDIGNTGLAGETNKIRIGTQGTHDGTFIAGISGVAVTGSQVVVNANGQLGVATSSARFKTEIKPINEASEAILALKPVTFRYKEQIDPDRIPQFGLIAEEVEKVNPDLVVRDGNGEIYTVRYDAVNAMLLNEFLKEHRTVQELRNELAALTATVKEQAAQIQKVIAQVELSKFATGRVCSDGTLRQIGLNDQ
jgi:hypothetical protein